MRRTVICSVSTFGVGLALAAGFGQGDTRLPTAQPPTLRLPAPKRYALPLPRMVLPRVPSLNAPDNVMPHSYLVYGLRTGPGGMAFTDRNGRVIPVPSNAQIHMGPFTTSPAIPRLLPPTLTLPKLIPPAFTLPGLMLPEFTLKK